MSKAVQEEDPAFGGPAGDAQAANTASRVRYGDVQQAEEAAVIDVSSGDEQTADSAPGVAPGDVQAAPETVVIDIPPGDEQPARGAFAVHVPPEDAQAANTASRVRPGNVQQAEEAAVIDVPTGDEQATGEHVVIDVRPNDEQARNPGICDYIFKVRGSVAEVIKPLRKEFIETAIPATYLGQMFGIAAYKPLFISVVLSVFCGSKPDLGEIRNIIAGCIQFEFRCFTEDRFLEILRDYKSGKIGKRLEEEFLNVGIKTTGLEVKIKNSEEVERTKTAIEKRYGI